MATTSNRKAWLEFLNNFFDAADERTRQACVDALNEAAEDVVGGMEKVFDAGRIVNRTGTLSGSLRNYDKARIADTKSGKRLLHAAIHTDEKTLRTVKNPGARNPKMRGRYPVSYGRLLEFSKRLNPDGRRDFFYGPWYEMKKDVKAQIEAKIKAAWGGK